MTKCSIYNIFQCSGSRWGRRIFSKEESYLSNKSQCHEIFMSRDGSTPAWICAHHTYRCVNLQIFSYLLIYFSQPKKIELITFYWKHTSVHINYPVRCFFRLKLAFQDLYGLAWRLELQANSAPCLSNVFKKQISCFVGEEAGIVSDLFQAQVLCVELS